MQDSKEIKEIVKEKYGEIAKKTLSGCGCSCGCADDASITGYTILHNEYSNLNGYFAEADLKLGCGIPTEHANIKEGNIVVDLGSGAGNDVFVVHALIGEQGKVIGVDMTEAMIEKANLNKQKLGFTNVEFRLGEIENLPVDSNTIDVVVSNCVLNLVPDKVKAFSEIYRILKPGGHFCISDIVLRGELPAGIKKSAEMYAGCVAGALQKEEYLKIIEDSGFKNVQIKTLVNSPLPEDILKDYLSTAEIEEYHKSGIGIYSITVYADKI